MFDVDCSSLDLRNTSSFVHTDNRHGQSVVQATASNIQNRNQDGASTTPANYGPQTLTGTHDTNPHRPNPDVYVGVDPKLNNASKIARYEQSIHSSRVNSLFKRDTLAGLYILSLLSGVSVLGIVGGAHNQERVFLSFSFFYGIFIPVVATHTCLVLDSVECVVFGLLFLITAPFSVSLSVLNRSHVSVSVSLILVAVFHLVAGRQGVIRIFLLGTMALFIWMCFGGVLDNPQRGDPAALIVVPGLQMIYVCLTGCISVLCGGARVV